MILRLFKKKLKDKSQSKVSRLSTVENRTNPKYNFSRSVKHIDELTGAYMEIELDFCGISPASMSGLLVLIPKLKIGEIEFPEAFDLVEAFERVSDAGKQQLITCTCGHFGCGGLFIDIENSTKFIRFLNAYDCLDKENQKITFDVKVSKISWIKLLNKCLVELKQISKDLEVEKMTIGTLGRDPLKLETIDETNL